MELIKRSTKGEALTWDDIDGNWLAIEEALNSQGRQKLYQITGVTLANSCSVDGVNTISVSGGIKILRDMDELPIIKACIVVNNKVHLSSASTDMFIGCGFPFVSGTTSPSNELREVELTPDVYPANISIYIWDEKGNYAEPYILVVSENPCSYVNVINCSVGPNLSTYTRVLSITANVKGSSSYTMQYKNDLTWIGVASVAGDNGEVTVSYPIPNDFPTTNKQVRLIDTTTGVPSAEQGTNFAFPDWYAWHLVPVCTCDEGQKFTIRFYIGTMPESSIAIEYESATGTWEHLHTFTYASPINLTEMGGGTIDVDVPEGVYNVRLRN